MGIAGGLQRSMPHQAPSDFQTGNQQVADIGFKQAGLFFLVAWAIKNVAQGQALFVTVLVN